MSAPVETMAFTIPDSTRSQKMRPILPTVVAAARVMNTKHSRSRAIASSTSAASPTCRPVKAVWPMPLTRASTVRHFERSMGKMGLSRSFTGSCRTRPVTVFFADAPGACAGAIPWLRPWPFRECFFGIAALSKRDKLSAVRSNRTGSVQEGAEKTNEPHRDIHPASVLFFRRESFQFRTAIRSRAANRGPGRVHGAQPVRLAADGGSGGLALGRTRARKGLRVPWKHTTGPDRRGGGRLAVRTVAYHVSWIHRRTRRGHDRGRSDRFAGACDFT